ncbi:MAG: hypothetical protein HQK89_17780, partial [Nitrospirae bacterium]|nr:hypothetical protein [Nitrospirota bacterium]
MEDFDKTRGGVGVFLPYQQRWIQDKKPVKILVKSRRIGGSWAEAGDDTLHASMSNGGDVWYIGYNKDMAIEFINDCANWARHFNEAASAIEEEVLSDEGKDILTFKIKFASGYRITALSGRPTNLRGKKGRVVIDEAAFVEDLDGLVKAAMALLMWGGDVRIISTHFGAENFFNELVNDSLAGKTHYSVHIVNLDDALNDGLYMRICEVLGRAWSQEAEDAWRQNLVDVYREHADEELFCIPSRSSGAYFTRALIESRMSADCKVLRLSCRDGFEVLPEEIRVSEIDAWIAEHVDFLSKVLNPVLPHYVGEDFARSGDLTVIMVFERRQDLSVTVPFMLELRNVPFKAQEQILFYILDRLPRFYGGAFDARGNGQYLAEVAMQRFGSRILQVMLTQEWYRLNMPRYKAAFEDGTITLPLDADIMDDHRMVRMEKGVPHVPDGSRTRGGDGGKRHGDSAIAGALG